MLETLTRSFGYGLRGTFSSNPVGTQGPSNVDEKCMYIDKPVVCGILFTLKVRLESVCYRALFRPLIPETYGRALQFARPLFNSNPGQVLVGFWRGTVARSKGPHRAVDCGWCGHNRLCLLRLSRGAVAMSNAPFMQRHVGDYLADTQELSTKQHEAYLLLPMTMWRHFRDPFAPIAFGSWLGKEIFSDMIGKVFPTLLWQSARWIWRWASLDSVFGGLTPVLGAGRDPRSTEYQQSSWLSKRSTGSTEIGEDVKGASW